MAIAVPLTEGASPNLKQRLARAERVNRWKAQALIAPLVIFLLLVFLVPIAALLYKSVGNPEVVTALPTTVVEVQKWDGKGLPPESVYKAMSLDLAETRKNSTLGDLSKRLNMELAGYRSLLSKTARALPFKTEPASYKEALEALDERWGDRRTGRRCAAIPAVLRRITCWRPSTIVSMTSAKSPRRPRTRRSIWTSSPAHSGWAW